MCLGECFKKGLKVVTYFKASETFPKASEYNVNTSVYAGSELGKSALASPIKNVKMFTRHFESSPRLRLASVF